MMKVFRAVLFIGCFFLKTQLFFIILYPGSSNACPGPDNTYFHSTENKQEARNLFVNPLPSYDPGEIQTAANEVVQTNLDKHIGQVEKTHDLSAFVTQSVGISIKADPAGHFLYFFEGRSGKTHKFEINENTKTLEHKGFFTIEDVELVSPRGFVYSREFSSDVFYFMDYATYQDDAGIKQKGLLYRYNQDSQDLSYVDLSDPAYGIGNSQVFGLARQNESIYVSFDPSGYGDHTIRVRRGILDISLGEVSPETDDGITQNVRPSLWEAAIAGNPEITGHMPGPGRAIGSNRVEPSRALTSMTIEGHDYLWGTVGNTHIYLIESKTGRGIFHFERPSTSVFSFFDMLAYGAGNLWVAERSDEGILVHRVSVYDNLNTPYKGFKRLRELRMQITSNVASGVANPSGNVYHTFSHPYSSDITSNQGVIPGSVRVNDLTGIPGHTVEHLYLDPSDDEEARQYYTLVTYLTDQTPETRQYRTEFFIKFWTRELKYFIYPHLVHRDSGPEGTRYLEDDEIMFGIDSTPDIYESFISRVEQAIASEYNTDPRMDHPYWAARNITEYVMENYHYPNDGANYFATYDFDQNHFNSHPGNLKAALSADVFYGNNIVACSGSGWMAGGALRFLGIPSQVVGSSGQNALTAEFFGQNTEATLTNGHRWNKVWLGNLYGWQDIDPTPRVPAGNAFNQKPRELSQWEIMQRTFFQIQPHRIIHNLQTEFWDKIHVPLRNACEHNVNMCGSMRYNLLGSYTNPELFNLSGHLLRTRAIQFIEDINVIIDQELMADITWVLKGDWEHDPDANLMVAMERLCLPHEACFPGYTGRVILGEDIPANQNSLEVNLGGFEEATYRMVVAKMEDPNIGNFRAFKLETITTQVYDIDGSNRLVQVYPNPTIGLLMIEADNVRGIEVFNYLGKLIASKQGQDLHYVDLTNQKGGIYLIRIYLDSEVFVKRVVLQQ